MSGAFHGDAAAKAAALARLSARVQAGTLANEVARYQADSASWAGELAQSSELMDLPAATGIPAGLGLAVDKTLQLLASQAQERDAAALALLAAIRPGAELAPVAAGLVPALLDDPQLAPWRQLPLVEQLCALQRRSAAGEAVPRSEWSALRQQIAAALEAPAADATTTDMLRLIEAAAWPMADSRSGLADVIWMVQHLTGALATRAVGWTPDDDKAVEQAMDAIAQAHAAEQAAGQRIDFMARLAEREPALCARMKQMREAVAASQIDVGRRVAALLQDAFAAA